jgi:hypothetical protein
VPALPAPLKRQIVPVTAALVALLAAAVPAHAAREIPVGVYNVNNSGLTQGPSRIYAIRFVLDHPARIERFYSGMNWEGVYADASGTPAPPEIRSSVLRKGYPSPPPPSDLPAGWSPGSGRSHYAHGTGGVMRARLVPMKPDGTPDLARVLAEDTYPALRRYRQLKSEFGFDGRSGLVYSDFGGAPVAARVPYFVIYQNVDPAPRENFVSLNSPVTSVQAAGPNGRNTLDPDAPGAIAGLDPREVVAWSLDAGQSWGFGRQVGGGPVPGDYTMSGDDAVRLPWYSWQERGSRAMHANQPYYAYHEKGRYTVRLKSAPRTTTLTEAGGYGPEGEGVGVVTVRNLRTGEVGRTGRLGSGMVRGRLDSPVRVERGDTYEISNTGTVAKAEGDVFLQKMGLVGPGETPYETLGNEYDRAELFALPHPWFAGGVAAPRRAPAARGARVFVSRARIVRRPVSASRRFWVVRRMRVRGGIERGRVRPGRRVVARALVRGRWRVLGRGHVRRGGRRFVITGRTRVAVHRHGLRVRAVVPGVGRSGSVRVALR